MIARRIWTLLGACTLVVLTLSGCSSSGSGGGSHSGPVVVTMTEKDGSITPSSDLVSATTGQPIEFKITTDAPDEIHVHSVPDHEFEVKPGPEQTFTFSISTPGTIEVESHGLDMTILHLKIS